MFVDESPFDRQTSIQGKAWALSGHRAIRKCFFVRGKRWVSSLHTVELSANFFGSYSLLPALSLDGIIWAKVVEGSFTSIRFQTFIEELLERMQPFPGPNSVIVMDNARIHKHPDIINTILARFEYSSTINRANQFTYFLSFYFSSMRVLFLPPYSPDYNPIELAFSTIKSFVKWAGQLGREELNQAEDDSVYLHLLDVAFSITPEHAAGYFNHCGYL